MLDNWRLLKSCNFQIYGPCIGVVGALCILKLVLPKIPWVFPTVGIVNKRKQLKRLRSSKGSTKIFGKSSQLSLRTQIEGSGFSFALTLGFSVFAYQTLRVQVPKQCKLCCYEACCSQVSWVCASRMKMRIVATVQAILRCFSSQTQSHPNLSTPQGALNCLPNQRAC